MTIIRFVVNKKYMIFYLSLQNLVSQSNFETEAIFNRGKNGKNTAFGFLLLTFSGVFFL